MDENERIRRERAGRLRQIRTKAKFPTATAASGAMRRRGFGVADPTYAAHENGTRGMSPSAALVYAKFYKIRPAWLLTGEGEPESELLPAKDLEEQGFTVVKTLPEYDIRAGASYGGGAVATGAYEDADIGVTEPVAQWGLPSTYVEGEVGLRFGDADIVAVEGDSMDDGSRYALVSGDRVIVDRRSINIRQGGIFVIWDGDGHVIKQVEYIRGSIPPRIVCKSLNKRYDDFEVVLDGNARIIGRVAVKITRM